MSFDWEAFYKFGWASIEQDISTLKWIDKARELSQKRINEGNFDPEQIRCDGTWFVGTNFLENDSSGTVSKVALGGVAVNSIYQQYGNYFNTWDHAQVSICYPGYPKQSNDETEAAFGYRRKRFGAHVDGILPVGRSRRRYAKEYHTFIYGIPLTNFNKFAAPIVVWEGSHLIMRRFLSSVLSHRSSEQWRYQDITQIYNEARKEVFSECKRKVLIVPVGGSYILHRLALHGIMPWEENDSPDNYGRMIAYFRPILKNAQAWLWDSI